MWIDDTSISPRGDTQLVDQQLNTKGKQREIWIRLQQPQQRNATLKTQPMPRAILPAILTSKRGGGSKLGLVSAPPGRGRDRGARGRRRARESERYQRQHGRKHENLRSPHLCSIHYPRLKSVAILKELCHFQLKVPYARAQSHPAQP